MSLPKNMTAIEISEYGGPNVLRPTIRPMPAPNMGEVLIRVSAAGVNRPDLIQRAGHYPPPPGQSDLPGLEVSGKIVAVGPETTDVSIGDLVCALTPGGGYAEYCKTPANHCLPIPTNISETEAAGLPETIFTVWHNVFQRAYLTAGESILIHGGSSGIGTTAIQLTKAFGATVYTTAGSDKKCAACRDLGAVLAFNYKEEDWPAILREVTQKRGVDVILDMVGGDYIQKNIDSLAVDGRLAIIAFLRGAKAELTLNRFMVKRQTITASTLRAQSDAAKANIAIELREKVWPLIADGRVRPIVDTTYPLEDASQAHEQLEASDHIGKLILKVSES